MGSPPDPVEGFKSGPGRADHSTMRECVGGPDGGGIVLGWLMRLTISLLLIGVLAFDVFSLAYTNLATVDDASVIAETGAQVLLEAPGDYDVAKAESVERAEDLGVRLRGRDWWVDDSGEVHVTVSRGQWGPRAAAEVSGGAPRAMTHPVSHGPGCGGLGQRPSRRRTVDTASPTSRIRMSRARTR
jgi:hypothetical protein